MIRMEEREVSREVSVDKNRKKGNEDGGMVGLLLHPQAHMEKEEEEEVGVNATAIVGVRVTIGREAEVIAGVAVWRVLIPV
mmetsp:Transcript_13554/g.15321  ORF Transcript_13554/g.15321 Transcript_13554/m.15321 type:complete len:81 (-) Transcript_13554:1415-1657(-)